LSKRPRNPGVPARPKPRLVRYPRLVVEKRIALAGLLVVAAGLGACRYDPTKEPEDLPEIPALQLTRVSEEARHALETARERVTQYPGDALLNGEFGMALHANRRFQEAATMYDRARKIDPRAFRWEYYRGVVLSEINDVAEAGAAFKRALKLRPNDPNALTGLAQLYFKSAKLADNEALEAEGDKTLDLLVEKNPDYIVGHFLKAARLEESGQPRAALAIYERLLEEGPGYGAVHQAAARLYGELGDSKMAERHQALAPQSASPAPPNQNPWMAAVNRLGMANMGHAARAQMLLQNRLTRPAIAEFELAVEEDPQNVSLRVNLVALYGIGPFAANNILACIGRFDRLNLRGGRAQPRTPA